MSSNAVLVTGAAGFIGFHVAERLLSGGREVVGLDIVNNYYDPRLKEARLDILRRHPNFSFVKLDLADRATTKSLFAQHRFPVVVHLAAQAGVRYSLENPHAYIDANIEGFINVLEGCRHNGCDHLLLPSAINPLFSKINRYSFSFSGYSVRRDLSINFTRLALSLKKAVSSILTTVVGLCSLITSQNTKNGILLSGAVLLDHFFAKSVTPLAILLQQVHSQLPMRYDLVGYGLHLQGQTLLHFHHPF